MCNGKEWDKPCRDFPHPRVRSKRPIRDQVTGFVYSEPKRSTGEELRDIDGLGRNGCYPKAEHEKYRDPQSRGTHVAAYTGEAQQLL
jgi:hypothetical protein